MNEEEESRELVTYEGDHQPVPAEAIATLLLLPFIPLIIAARITQLLVYQINQMMQPPQPPKMRTTELHRDPKTGRIVEITERWI